MMKKIILWLALFLTLSQQAEAQGPIWGVFHSIHTLISDGTQSIAERTDNLKMYYDFASTIDHDFMIDNNEWLETIDEVNANPNFTYFVGYEWQGTASHYTEVTAFFVGDAPATKVDGNNQNYDTLGEFTDWLRANNGLGCIAHPARRFNVAIWTEAEYNDEQILPCVEMLNKQYYHWNDKWICAEGSGCTTYNNPSPDSSDWRGAVKNALDNGLRLGFVAGWDYHGGYPGIPTAYTGLADATEWTKEAVVETIRKRHTWAAEDYIMMNVTSGPYIMGDAFNVSEYIVTIYYGVTASPGKTITDINIFVDGIIVKVHTFSNQENVLGSFDIGLDPDEHYIFIEAIQSNGKRAWSSPMYITYNLCGNGVQDEGEECDGDDFGGQTCEDLGYSGGNLACNLDCTLDTSTCIPDPFAPGVSFDLEASNGDEATSPATLSVSLSEASSETITVDYAVTGGTSTPGEDYTLYPGTLIFNPGITLQIIFIDIEDDTLAENDETIEVTLSSPTNANLGTTTSHVYTINDNDESGNLIIRQFKVADGIDDAEESDSGSMYLTSTDLELVYAYDWPGNQTVGIRFNGVDIPPGATIIKSYLQFQADETSAEETLLKIAGENSDNASPFNNFSWDISSRERTMAEVWWSPEPWTIVGEAGVNQRTPEISSIISEIVNLPGWSAGNALAFIITGTGYRVAESYDGNQNGAPLMHVEYLTDTSNQPPELDAGPDRTIYLPNNSVFLDATIRDDGLPNPPGAVTTSWNQVSGPGVVLFADESAVDTTATFPGEGTYVLKLEADDGELTASDEVTIVVNEESSEIFTLEIQVAAGADDAEESASGTMYLTSSDLELVYDDYADAGNQKVGMRFAGVDIPQGATIYNAYVQFQVDETGSEETYLTIEGEFIDNAQAFTKFTGDISSRIRTLAKVLWSPEPWTTIGEAGFYQQTTDIASVVQEIVDRPGWTSGNSLVIIISGYGKRTAESFNGDPDGAPLLHVEYSTEPSNQRPTVAISTPADNSSFTFGDTVTFIGTGSDVEDGDLTAVLYWSSDLNGPLGMGGSVSTSILSLGTHTITATATDSDGLTGSAQISITVNSPNNAAPVADFIYTTDNFTASFTDTSQDSDGIIVAWSWNFGDGNTSAAQNPSHTYAAEGTYIAALTVTDDQGAASEQNTQSVTVTALSEITLTAKAFSSRNRNYVDLEWSGANSKNVDIFRDNALIKTTRNDGSYRDNIGAGANGNYTYVVCEEVTAVCSNPYTVTLE
jgi:PKD repeat protein